MVDEYIELLYDMIYSTLLDLLSESLDRSESVVMGSYG